MVQLPALALVGRNRVPDRNALLSGLQTRAGFRETQQAEQANSLAPQAAQGDTGALNALAGVDAGRARDIQAIGIDRGNALLKGREQDLTERKFTAEQEELFSTVALGLLDAAQRNPELYPQIRERAIQAGFAAEDIPEQFDPQFVQSTIAFLRARSGPATAVSPAGKLQSDVERGILTPEQAAAAGKKQPLVTIDNSGKADLKGQEELSKVLGKRLAGLLERGEKARNNEATLQRAMSLADQVETGAFLEDRAAFGRVLAAANFDPEFITGLTTGDIGTVEALQAISNELTLGKIGGEGGIPANNFSDADREFIQSTVPQISNTPRGFRLKVEAQLALEKRAQEIEQVVLDGQAQNKTVAQITRDISEFAQNNPVFTKDEKKALTAATKGETQDFGAMSSADLVQAIDGATPEELDAIEAELSRREGAQ